MRCSGLIILQNTLFSYDKKTKITKNVSHIPNETKSAGVSITVKIGRLNVYYIIHHMRNFDQKRIQNKKVYAIIIKTTFIVIEKNTINDLHVLIHNISLLSYISYQIKNSKLIDIILPYHSSQYITIHSNEERTPKIATK